MCLLFVILINVCEIEMVLIVNILVGINFVVDGLDWKEGDNIVILVLEFFFNFFFW